MLVTREFITAKLETTYNVDSVPTPAADAIQVSNLAWAPEGLRMVERPVIKPTFGKLKSVFAGELRTITFDTELRGSGTIDSPPETGVLWRAAGLAQTINASTSVIYDVASSAIGSITMYFYMDGTYFKLTGGRVKSVSASLETGSIGKLSWTVTGHVGNHIDITPAAPAYDTTVPAPLIGIPFTIGGYSPSISKMEFTVENSLSLQEDISAPDGYGELIITDRNVSGSFDPMMHVIAVKDFYSEFKAGTEFALTTGVIGGTAGNRVRIDMPKIYYNSAAPADREGVRTYELGFVAIESASDDELTITHT